MKAILLISLITLSTVAQGQGWQARSTEYQRQQQLSVGKADNATVTDDNTSVRPTTKSVVTRPEYHGEEMFRIYDAWLTLGQDQDHDGYYSEFSLNFDVDTYYDIAAVYAVLYLGVNDEFREYHSTSVFTLYGEDSDDALEVNTTLVEGFASDDYEVLIEIYDADSNSLVAVYDGYSDSDLLYIPLESLDYEYTQSGVVVNYEGGSNGIITTIALLLLAGARRLWRFL